MDFVFSAPKGFNYKWPFVTSLRVLNATNSLKGHIGLEVIATKLSLFLFSCLLRFMARVLNQMKNKVPTTLPDTRVTLIKHYVRMSI